MNNKVLILLLSVAWIVSSCEDSLLFPNGDLTGAICDTWNCSEDGSLSGSQAYLVDISRWEPYSDTIVLDNFYNIGFGKEVIGIVSGQDIEIPEQIVDGFTFTGNGRIQDNATSISFEYTADDGSGEIDNLSAIYLPR